MPPKKGTYNLANAKEKGTLPTNTNGPVASAFLEEGAINDLDNIMNKNAYYSTRSGSCAMLVCMMMGHTNEKGEALYTYEQIMNPNLLREEKLKFYKEFRESTLNPKRDDTHFQKYDQLLVEGTKRLADGFVNEINEKIKGEDNSWLFDRDLYIKSDLLMGATTNTFGDSKVFRSRNLNEDKIKNNPKYAKQAELIATLRENTSDYIQIISPQNITIQQSVTDHGNIKALQKHIDEGFGGYDFDIIFNVYDRIGRVRENLKELGDIQEALKKKQFNADTSLPGPYIEFLEGVVQYKERREEFNKVLEPVINAMNVINTNHLTRIGTLHAAYNGTLAKSYKIELGENENVRVDIEKKKAEAEEKRKKGLPVGPDDYIPEIYNFDVKSISIDSDKINKLDLIKEAFESAPQDCMKYPQETYAASKEFVGNELSRLKALESRNPSTQWKMISEHLSEMSTLLEQAGKLENVPADLKDKIGKTFDKLDYAIDDYVEHKNSPKSTLKGADMKRVAAVKEINNNLKAVRNILEQPALDKNKALNDSVEKDPFSNDSLKQQTDELTEIYNELKATRRTFDGSSQKFDELLMSLDDSIRSGKSLQSWKGEKSFQSQFLPGQDDDNEYAEMVRDYNDSLGETLKRASVYLNHKKIVNNESNRSLTRIRVANQLEKKFGNISKIVNETFKAKENAANADVDAKLEEMREKAQKERQAKQEKEREKARKEQTYDSLMNEKFKKMQDQQKIFYQVGSDGKVHGAPANVMKAFFSDSPNLPGDKKVEKNPKNCCKQLRQDLVMVFSGLSKDESIVDSGKKFFTNGEMTDALKYGAQTQYKKIEKMYSNKPEVFKENWEKAERIAIQGMANEFSKLDRLDERAVFAANIVKHIMPNKPDVIFPYEQNLIQGMQQISTITQKGFVGRDLLANTDNVNTPEAKEALADYLTMRVVESQMRQFARKAEPNSINPFLADIGSGKPMENTQKLKEGIINSNIFKKLETLSANDLHELVKNNPAQNDKAMEQFMESLGGDVYAKKNMKANEMSKDSQELTVKNFFGEKKQTAKQSTIKALPMEEKSASNNEKKKDAPQKGGLTH